MLGSPFGQGKGVRPIDTGKRKNLQPAAPSTNQTPSPGRRGNSLGWPYGHVLDRMHL